MEKTVATVETLTILRDRLETYKSFLENLIIVLDKLYLDKETLADPVDMRNHYNYCFNKVSAMFNKEGFHFEDNEELKEYLYAHFKEQFYELSEPNDVNEYLKFWDKIWSVKISTDTKMKKRLNVLIEIYSIFDKSIN